MSDFSQVFNAHPSFIEAMYLKYQEAPESVDQGWRTFFEGFDFAAQNGAAQNGTTVTSSGDSDFSEELKVLALIKAFRNRGHLLSTTNPIRTRLDRKPNLDIADFGFQQSDLTKTFKAGQEIGMKGEHSLKDIIARLKAIYSGNIGFEYEQIQDRIKRRWIRERIEGHTPGAYGFSTEKKKRILEKLNGAVIFEKFLHTKYIGQKRFSLEGGETTIAALDAIIQESAKGKVEEVVIGMAHRGRLNVLANIMNKTYEHIFNEFEGNFEPDQSFGDGDVKYHMGYSSQVEGPGGKTVNLKLAPNPSHLEAVNPVVEGFARAKADILYGSDYDKILPILIHGDAAVAGQGVVFETVQMSQLEGYYTGGTIHFVINNQIGFTTDFEDARSSTYSTAAANIVGAPVFHVNGDDPEAVVFAAEMAIAYRQEFNTDVFIDMVCYRRHGHNEGDDPKFTQPYLYSLIDKHPNPREIYVQQLTQSGDFGKEIADEMEKKFWSDLQKRLDLVKEKPLPYALQQPEEAWRLLDKNVMEVEAYFPSPETGIKRETIDHIIQHLMKIPEGAQPLSKFNRLLKGKRKLLDKNNLDWAMGELMAYGSLLMDGRDVRMSGQDVKRGTFSHRHAIINDAETFEEYNRLDGLSEDQGKYRIFNSFLSEFAVLGFEYGYSLATPENLVIWEAQFGDFYNGAQVMVDQFITAAESKWRRMSGLVMLLPHGYEGQGPEHSSARLERFLQACAEFNMTVANITTPANLFHIMRRQLARPYRKPLVIMSPKSLLRHPLCVSKIEDFETGNRFEEVIDDIDYPNKTAKQVKRVLYCTGKIYYELLERKRKDNREDIAIVRIEQLYPFPTDMMDFLTHKKYKNAKAFWVQEEPSNMGAWQYILAFYRNYDIQLIARKSSASPATGFKKQHEKEQKAIIDEAFGA